MDGPYGRSTDYSMHGVVVLVAGGIGVTPMMSIFDELVGRMGDAKKVHMPHSCIVLPFFIAFKSSSSLFNTHHSSHLIFSCHFLIVSHEYLPIYSNLPCIIIEYIVLSS